MSFDAGYSKVKTKDGGKFYAPAINSLGKTVHLKRVHRTAVEALNYSRRFCKEWTRFTHGKKEVSSS